MAVLSLVRLMDYPQFERLYYALVAGFDVFGNQAHQTNVRRYMDFLRIEAEMNFVSFMPREVRTKLIKSWYLGDDAFEDWDDIKLLAQSTPNLKLLRSSSFPSLLRRQEPTSC